MLSSRLLLSHTPSLFFFFFFNDPSTTEIYTLSLHDALPISKFHLAVTAAEEFEVSLSVKPAKVACPIESRFDLAFLHRSEEHTSELQSPYDLVCRLLLEKKKKKQTKQKTTQQKTTQEKKHKQ